MNIGLFDLRQIVVVAALLVATTNVAAGDKALPILSRQAVTTDPGDNHVRQRCLTPEVKDPIDLGVKRDRSWSLPSQALDAMADRTIEVLVLRFDFQREDTDDPNTTGRGVIDLSNPLATPEDSAAYYDTIGHWIDPPPHNAAYFDAHMQALSRYWETVSEGKIDLHWEIFPPESDAAYTLPHPMSHYGKCGYDSVVYGLELYFIDCIETADAETPAIDFARYESIFLFHAGSDRQNDIGFPETCNDLFTGFISFGDSVWVDNGATFVRTALMMPETACQDNRATALNAVLAHEFGHQLGLVDIYSTNNFMTQLGDFSLMDNNGFGTGIDFGFDAGRVFGAMPLFPTAWSRAHLGFVDVHDFRQGTDITLAAAAMISDSIKIARIPITEKEYYLLENRVIEIDGKETGVRADSATGVIQGPVEIIRDNEGNLVGYGSYSREYDQLMPGSGMLIYHVDEAVAGLDYDGDGMNNFDDNDLQWDSERRFIRLIEGDGQVHLGGYYRSGFGRAEDMYRDDRNTSFTPNTNPPAIDNSGNNTHIYVSGISRDIDTVGLNNIYIDDNIMRFDLETDRLAPGFPIRAGSPAYHLNVIADDLNRDGTDELIVASQNLISVFTTEGERYIRKFYTPEADTFYDTALASIHTGRPHPVPLFVELAPNQVIWSGPVTGDFGEKALTEKLVAVGIPYGESDGRILIYKATDDDHDGQADLRSEFITSGTPIAITFGHDLYGLTSLGNVYHKTGLVSGSLVLIGTFVNDEYHGICRAGEAMILMAGDEDVTTFYVMDDDHVDSISLNGHFRYGPIAVDVDRDGVIEIVGVSANGEMVLISVDQNQSPPDLSLLRYQETGATVTVNPIAADIDDDGYPDIICGGPNAIYAFNHELTAKTGFPIEIDDGLLADNFVSAPPIVSDLERGGRSEIVAATAAGNIYAYGQNLAYGFPLSAGELAAGSPITLNDSTGGWLGYLGGDGWFYMWQVDADSTRNYWPMGGADPTNSLTFDSTRLISPVQFSQNWHDDRFYNYPNPVVDGHTTIRYFLGKEANRVRLTIYDLSGIEIDALSGPTSGGLDNEVVWNCDDVSPGVYRCFIKIDFSGSEQTAFTDIAIIR
ncbi:MAG: hypothetical protein KOO62_11870 [candidate division Zixibacteria bacterium]|nr:hypothetical protein [candidate division Zixibacteria bacterium]